MDPFGKSWQEKTYDVSAILDYAFETSGAQPKMITVLADINNIGLNAFNTPSLKELYFVGDTPATLSSTSYNLPDNYPFGENPDLKIYVKQSKMENYADAWNVGGNTLNFNWQIPAKTLAYRATACFPFDVVYQADHDVKPYVTIRLGDNMTQQNIASGNAYVLSRSIDDYTVPAFQPVLLVSKQSADVESYCRIREAQGVPAIDTDHLKDYMMGTIEETELNNTSEHTLYGLSDAGLFKKIGEEGNTLTWFKAYLSLDNSEILAGSRNVIFLFEDEQGTTGVNSIEQTGKHTPYYNLSGLKVEKPQRGIYISNGKK